MKCGLIIQDLTPEQARQIIDQLEGDENVHVSASPSMEPMEPSAESTAVHVQQAGRIARSEPAASTTSANDVELDSKGISWDERIHATTKLQTGKGIWKKRRGIDDDLYDTVMSELANQQSSMSKKIAKAEETVGITPPVVPVAAPPVTPTPVPAAPMAQPVAIEPPKRNFEGLMQQMKKLFTEKSITPEYPNSIVARINEGFKPPVAVTTLTDIANDDRMVEYAWMCLDVDKKVA